MLVLIIYIYISYTIIIFLFLYNNIMYDILIYKPTLQFFLQYFPIHFKY